MTGFLLYPNMKVLWNAKFEIFRCSQIYNEWHDRQMIMPLIDLKMRMSNFQSRWVQTKYIIYPRTRSISSNYSSLRYLSIQKLFTPLHWLIIRQTKQFNLLNTLLFRSAFIDSILLFIILKLRTRNQQNGREVVFTVHYQIMFRN